MPVDEEYLCSLEKNHRILVTMEDNVASGGMGEHIASILKERHSKLELLPISIPDSFVEHGSVEQLRAVLKLDADSVVEKILSYRSGNEQS